MIDKPASSFIQLESKMALPWLPESLAALLSFMLPGVECYTWETFLLEATPSSRKWLLIFLQSLASLKQVDFTLPSGSPFANGEGGSKETCALIKLVVSWNLPATLLGV